MATTITYTIATEKITEFKEGFLKFKPVPLDDNGDPTMSEAAWIKLFGKEQFMWAYKNGKSMLALEANTAQTDLIS